MGVESRRPPLPAPTDISSSAIGNTSDDLATDISRRTDRTSYSIPEDGSPVTINTKKQLGGSSRRRDQDASQTSLLIEYFEGGKTTGAVHSRPSVRVRVTPSGSKKSRREGDHIQLTEIGKNRKPSYTRRISLPRDSDEPLIPSEVSSSSSTRPPVDIEVLQNHSDISQYDEEAHRRFVAQSEISSMPTDSLLEGTPFIYSPTKQSLATDTVEIVTQATVMDTLKAPSRQRSLSRERLTQKAMKKIKEHDSGRVRDSSSKGKSSSRRSSRSDGTSREYVVDDGKSSKSRSSKYRDDDHLGSDLQPSEISVLSDRSAGQSSVRSGMTASSINNPKLLNAVEDAIKRLILPELNALKEEQKTQKNRYKFDDFTKDSMAPVGSRENLRRVSKSSSSPNVNVVGKPGIISDDRGVILPLEPVKSKKSRRSSRSSDKSHDTAIHEEIFSHRRSSREKSEKSEKNHSHKVAAASAIAGAGLTAAALRHHDSVSSLDYDRERDRERRKKRSKSRSRSASISESIEASPHKDHNIPPLPIMESHVGTDITRDSIRSVETDRPHSRSSRGEHTPTREREIREVIRGSPKHVISAPQTPTRSPLSMRKETTATHGSHSPGNFSPVSAKSGTSISAKATAAALAAAGLAGTGLLTADHQNKNEHSNGRGLSPVQSAASYEDVEVVEHDRVRSIRSGDSLSGGKKHKKTRSTMSMDSLSSTPSTNLALSKKRPEGISLEQGFEILPEHERAETPQAGETEDWFEHEHQENDRYRDEFRQDSELGSSVTGNQRETMYTDNSMDYDYTDRSLEDHDIRGVGANPEYVRTPVAVESAVASLHEPSILSVQSSQKSASIQNSPAMNRHFDNGNMADLLQQASSRERWEAIRDQAIETARQASNGSHSKTSLDEKPAMGASALPLLHEQEPAIGHGLAYEESDVTTNPSIIQGPIGGGYDHDNREHWPYDPTPIMPSSKMPETHHTRDVALAGAGTAAVGLGLAAANHSKESTKDRGMSRNHGPTMEDVQDEHWEDDVGSPGLKNLPSPAPNQFGYNSPNGKNLDEGYISNTIPGGEVTPDPYVSGNGRFDDQKFEQYDQEDPFTTTNKSKHLSGLSAGMESPLYDSATGTGIDRIQSKDVVALMDHLTVRDAQRSARDTEILVTLVRSAAEMRNQFDDMKKYIAEQDRLLMQNSDKNADVVIRTVGGPRPQPASGSPRGTPRRQYSDEREDSRGEKKNIFRRALKGLRGNNDLGKIEDMLMQLLDEVEGLKDGQGVGGQRPAHNNSHSNSHSRSTSLNSYENLRAAPDSGYEPEGQAGTSSSPAISANLSNPSSKFLGVGGMHSGYDNRRVSEGHRISTVLEGDEEGTDYRPNSGQNQLDEYDDDRNLTPTQEVRRGNSVPMDTPPEQSAQFHSGDPTPKSDKTKKHKSNTSSIFGGFPKMSRWSKTTTASSAPDPESVRNSTNKKGQRPYSEMSRSASNLNVNQYDDDEYSLREEDRIRSQTSLSGRRYEQSRSPSPLIPEERRSMEDPKYQAHRNSLNLQHPQPRPGPTHRHQTYLESQAVNYENPPTPDQDQWGNTPALALNRNRFSAGSGQSKNLSPVYSEGDEDAYSQHSASEQAHNRLPPQTTQQAPARPPKIREGEDGPLVPPKVPLIQTHDNNPPQDHVVGMGYQSPFSNSGMHIASPLEPIAEVRYSLETDRSSGGRQHMTPSPRPTAMQSVARKITGPREMPQRRNSPGAANLGTVRRKPIPQVRSPVQSLESYRGESDESETF
ncbi:hypothetical protein EJ08DRAFT_721142 [Tothia fuscella]|uniref:Transaldolase n=1 Tax=Tothia fuscella TaxID=1048955 RepID=A0A9P4TW08_9PEZI|nr:hypothetical protein EJ08DRAFT_721142 [Tothia fuscella]